MNKEEKALTLIKQCLKELEAEIERHGHGKGIIGTIIQLRSFKMDLETMLEQLESNQLPPRIKRDFGISYTIIDNWEHGSELGNLLLSTEQAYRKL